ncbi:hypothetical protein Goklo_001043, partial [Gossypium klotzschianum]|nr:hypothetical protein [Gossypium klotzschianum]
FTLLVVPRQLRRRLTLPFVSDQLPT